MLDSVKQFVLQLIEKKTRLPEDVDVDLFNYIDTGYIDSIGIIKFVLEIESEYNIEISDADIESEDFRTVGGVVSLIQRRLENKEKND